MDNCFVYTVETPQWKCTKAPAWKSVGKSNVTLN